MDLLRAAARPLLAAPFILDGLDALTRPKRHVKKFAKVQPVLERAGLPPFLTADISMLTRATGAVSVVAGLGLATGRSPRTCAALLAVINVPLTAVNNPVWMAADGPAKKAALSGMLRGAAIGGGLTLAAFDRQGRPSLRWRLDNRRQQCEAIKAAKASVRSRYVGA